MQTVICMQAIFEPLPPPLRLCIQVIVFL